MSQAGIRSNRGDYYQKLIAFDWALSVLSNPDYQWIEIDSTTYLVDDIVICKSDGTLICCQCKKNQPSFTAWSIADLADELDKAFRALVKNPQVEIHFYSRNDFGSLAKLREYSITYDNEDEYRANLTAEHKRTEADLAARIARSAPALSTYEFLSRTYFNTTEEFNRTEEKSRERLRRLASNSETAYNTLWTCLEKLGARISVGDSSASMRHRLTRDELKTILCQSGAILAPTISKAQVRESFASTSAIGRSWRRDIAAQRISNPVINQLLTEIDAGKRSILLTGLPGSGKTCVMLGLQETLEDRAQTRQDIVPLFIQSREFVELTTARERQAQGLPENWVEQAARLADDARVVVIIDSLDVLSIAREHSLLTYFLAQIDKLLLIPKITVITACRDFDRKYDRRIAAREWDCELQCLPLDWDAHVVPLLEKLKIDCTTIDHATRELIRNPRELALYVELASHGGSFNVVTSQALAQRYLNTIVQADPALGETAMEAIESIANEMLQLRTLSIPRQRFIASQDILRQLHSLNVLQETHDGKLTFGHQTLLDVLVISGALRRGVSLNEFIEGLPPVPFVRPSIRSFVAQLAAGDRREFRKQIRAVLTGNAAFHVRRLVAESFVQQIPRDDDWPLIRDLRTKHRDIFQVIYLQASMVEWHHFWVFHLVPALKETRDAEGMAAHVHRVAQWKNTDADGVLGFWMEALALDWLDGNSIAEQLGYYLSELDTEYLTLAVPLLERLLSMPKPEHSLLGHTVARSIAAGVIDDKVLWNYIAGDISDSDVMGLHLGNRLRCQPHEFGTKYEDFLKQRMEQSTTLLNLSLAAIEQWSQIRSTHYGRTRVGYRHGFLSETSYIDIHSQSDFQHVDGDRMLFDAIEAAILDHAQKHSNWWQQNRQRLCSTQEGALCYFAVLACTKSPLPNIDWIGRMLSDRNLLECELSYELCALIRAAFIYLDSDIQDAVMATIQTVWEEPEQKDGANTWQLKKRAEYIHAIPGYLRSAETQAILDACEKMDGTYIRQPHISSRGGMVTAPFSYEVFLNISDTGVLGLLAHYAGYEGNTFDDFLVGGEQEVGLQLYEAASRHPLRFLGLLVAHWAGISTNFRDNIMDGIATYLKHRFGNLQINGTWVPVEESDASALANQILDELERHPDHWRIKRSTAKALNACANVIQDSQKAERLVVLAIDFATHVEEKTIQGDSIDLITAGINMISGRVTEALMILANNLQEQNIAFPELLAPTLRQFAISEHTAIRALILRGLPYLQYRNPELGWELFDLALRNSTGLWKMAEDCLYYAYNIHFERVAPVLDRIHNEGSEKDLETWGRISALSALGGHIEFANLLGKLNVLDVTEAWKGVADVWTHPKNIEKHREQCLAGIEAGLKTASLQAAAVARYVENIFRHNAKAIPIPIELIHLWFSVSENNPHRLFGFNKWLNAISQHDPELALSAFEIYVAHGIGAARHFHDHENQLVQLMTRLFAEAEEREESDSGGMLRRVVLVQDKLLSLGITSISDWLKSAERL